MSEDYGFIIDNMRWSFSRLNSFYNCPYEWKRKYIDCEYGEDGFFGEFGTHCHKMLEKFAKGETSIFEISQLYSDTFDEDIPHDAPPNSYVDLRQSYYDKGLDYFNNFDLHLENYIVLGIEKEVKFELGGKEFIGFIDLLLKDKQTDEITILDHKSATLHLNKNGTVGKKDSAHFLEFKHQLYLYSIPVIAEYDKVDYFRWNLFKDQKELKIPFNQDEFEESVKWAEDTIKLIENEKEWLPNPQYYFCNYLCSQRNNCCEFKA